MILYKYYPCDQNTFKSLAVPGLWCHRAAAMNDPFECLSGADIAYERDELEKFREYVKSRKNLESNCSLKTIIEFDNDKINKHLEEYRQKLISGFAFCSLSRVCDSVLMWSHYANAHAGCVLGIEFEDEEHIAEVIYDEAPRKLDLMKFAELIGGEGGKELRAHVLAQLSVKGPMWKGEQEWRIWRKEPTYFKYRLEQIKEVYFGVNCPIEIKVAITKMLDGLCDGFLFDEMEMKYNPLRLES